MNLERHHHPAESTPVWNRTMLPKTKKYAREITGYSEIEWQRLFSRFLDSLAERYHSFSDKESLRIEALMTLGFTLRVLQTSPENPEIIEQFRKLSKKHHPDRGGDAEVFRRIKTARDFLLQYS